MAPFSRTRVIWVDQLDRQMAEAEAIGRAVKDGSRWARVVTATRFEDPATRHSLWEITLKVSRRRLP